MHELALLCSPAAVMPSTAGESIASPPPDSSTMPAPSVSAPGEAARLAPPAAAGTAAGTMMASPEFQPDRPTITSCLCFPSKRPRFLGSSFHPITRSTTRNNCALLSRLTTTPLRHDARMASYASGKMPRTSFEPRISSKALI